MHTLRPTLIYDDSGNKFIEQLVSLGRRVRMVPLLGFKDPKLQPVHASDVASIVTQLVSHGVAETHIIAGATPIGLHEIAKAISRHVIAIPIPTPYFFSSTLVSYFVVLAKKCLSCMKTRHWVPMKLIFCNLASVEISDHLRKIYLKFSSKCDGNI